MKKIVLSMAMIASIAFEVVRTPTLSKELIPLRPLLNKL